MKQLSIFQLNIVSKSFFNKSLGQYILDGGDINSLYRVHNTLIEYEHNKFHSSVCEDIEDSYEKFIAEQEIIDDRKARNRAVDIAQTQENEFDDDIPF